VPGAPRPSRRPFVIFCAWICLYLIGRLRVQSRADVRGAQSLTTRPRVTRREFASPQHLFSCGDEHFCMWLTTRLRRHSPDALLGTHPSIAFCRPL